MRAITMVSLGASAVLGAGALIVAKTSLPTATPAPGAGMLSAPLAAGSKPVVVASRDIAYGDTLDAAHLAIVQLPPGAAPAGAFPTIAAALAQDAGGAPVALTAISAREPILPSKVSGPGARASVAAEITKGFRAYTIKISDVTGVGGHALPGDRVDVVLMRDLTGTNGGAVGARNLVSDVVLQNVRVLGINLNANPTENKPAPPTNATLEVSVKDAQKLAVAASLGEISLALRGAGAAEVERVRTLRGGEVAPGAPRGASRARPGARAAPAQPTLIRIVEGDGDSKSGV